MFTAFSTQQSGFRGVTQLPAGDKRGVGPAGGACSADPFFTGCFGGAIGNCWDQKTSGRLGAKTLQKNSFPSWKGNGGGAAECCQGEWELSQRSGRSLAESTN